MNALRELQRSFQDYVLGDEGLREGERREAGLPAMFPAAVDGAGAVSAEDRLHVYAYAIRARFLEVLGQDYPGLHTLAGDDRFRAIGLAYMAAHPSHHPSIRWFGRHLPDFLGSTSPWREHPVLGEMARFEWGKGELLDAADSPVVGVDDIAAIPPSRWTDIRPRLKPAVRRLRLEWNVPVLWTAIDRGDAPPAPARMEAAAHWLLWRDDLLVRWRSVEPDEAWALDCCVRGEDFGAICAGLVGRVGEDAAAFRAATCLKQWAADGVLEAV